MDAARQLGSARSLDAGSLRVEAAAWRGRPISFYIVGSWTVPDRGGSPPRPGQGAYAAAEYIVLATACMLGWLNFRARKTDLPGATKLAALCWFGIAVSDFFHAHHVGSLAEINTFWKVVLGKSASDAAIVWIEYLALEPWVRRTWPHTLISWSRYTVKGWRDALVGRDLLYSAGIGAVLALLDLLRFASRDPASSPDFPDLFALAGVGSIIGTVLFDFSDSLFGMVGTFFVLFLMRVGCGKSGLQP